MVDRRAKHCNSLAYLNEHTHLSPVEVYSPNQHSSFFDRSSTFNEPVERILLWRQRRLTSGLILEDSSAHWTAAAFNTGGNIEFTTWAPAINRKKKGKQHYLQLQVEARKFIFVTKCDPFPAATDFKMLICSKLWVFFKTVIMSGGKWLGCHCRAHLIYYTAITATGGYVKRFYDNVPVQCSQAISSNDSPWCVESGQVEWWPGSMWTATVSWVQAGPLYLAARQEATLAPSLSREDKPSPMTEWKSGEAVCVLPHLSGPKGHPLTDKRVLGRKQLTEQLGWDSKVWRHVIQLLAPIHALFPAISINYISILHSVGATHIRVKSVLTSFESNLNGQNLYL